ncbi:MAG: serine hydrolase domain-containing protein, partial [Bacteroidota bacterium]
MKYSLPFFLLLFLLPSLGAQSLTDAQRAAIDSIISPDVPAGGPGMAVGVLRDGEPIYVRYAGLADVKQEIPIGPASRFNIASLAKQFTAFAILELVEQGKISLADDVRQYLPELYPDIKDPITMADLLNHTSGIRGFTNLWSLQGITWWKAKLGNDDVLVTLSQQTALNHPPGTQRMYTNSNYVLLTHIVARVTGQSFKTYTDAMFQRLNMPHT